MIKKTLQTLLLLTAMQPAHAEILFEDSFESGDMSATNPAGFKWGKNDRTSIVTMNPKCGGLKKGDPTAIYNNKPICNGPQTPAGGGDWQAYSGDNALRFRYPAGEPMAEQRFDLGGGYTELWISYWLRVPVNFSRGPGTNNKWFKFWMGDGSLYDASGVSQFQLQDNPSSDSRSIKIRLGYDNGADSRTHYGPDNENFVTPADAGRWMHLVYYMRASTGQGATDGEIAAWRKWEDESSYTSLGDLTGIEIPVTQKSIDNGYAGWGTGYILGWANAPYKQDTEWLLDDFRISDESLLGVAPRKPTSINIR